MTVADNSERLPSHFPAIPRDLVPDAVLELTGAIEELTRQNDDFGHDELCDRTRVREGRVKDGDACTSSAVEINLISANAEAADDQQLNA